MKTPDESFSYNVDLQLFINKTLYKSQVTAGQSNITKFLDRISFNYF